MNRRELLKNIAAGTTTLMVVPAFLTSCEDDPEDPGSKQPPGSNELVIDLADEKYSALSATGGHVIESAIIIINTGDGYLALSSVCTHNGCTIDYDHSAGNLPCPCHGSVFSTTGSVLQGPADSPLKKYEASLEGGTLTIAL